MKKTLAVLLSAMMLVGCGGNTPATETDKPVESNAPVSEKVGAGSVTTVKANDASEDKEGLVSVSTTYAGLVLDGDVVKYLYLDEAKGDSKFDTKGVVAEQDAIKTKKELKEDYGMKKIAKSEHEWYEQAEALEKWAVGKKIDDVLALKVSDKDGKKIVDDEDLKTSVTIDVTNFLKAIEVAKNNAKDVEGVAFVGMGSVTDLRNANATEDKAGKVEDNTTFTLLALDKDKKIVALDLDVAQAGAGFDVAGKVAEHDEVVPTKGEKQDKYGMKEFGKATYEWFEQRDSFAKWALGKTVDDVVKMPVAEGSHGGKVADDADLKTTCTISVDAFLASVEAANAHLVELGK